MIQQPPKPSDEEDDSPKDTGYILRHRTGKYIEPLPKATHDHVPSQNAAVKLVQNKLNKLYAKEPNARQELATAAAPFRQPSKHQQIMYHLSISGKPLAQIQTAWHEYYQSLPDSEKHEVWQEFYQEHARQPSAYTRVVAQAGGAAANPEARWQYDQAPQLPTSRLRAVTKIKKHIIQSVSAGLQSEARAAQHVRSLFFGLGMGLLLLAILFFGFFNEVIITPFIQPSRSSSDTPIILTADSIGATDTPEVIIPKIGVEIPNVYGLTSLDEHVIQTGLESGVIHYPSTVLPGQKGNAAYFGHSSNNIFNRGKYKFAFVLLHELVPGDIFYLTYDKTVYTYRVFDRKIVSPADVSVLGTYPDKLATATLITCDPPGTSTNRLVVTGEQISPDPAGASAPTEPPNTKPSQLTGNGPSMLRRAWEWLVQ